MIIIFQKNQQRDMTCWQDKTCLCVLFASGRELKGIQILCLLQGFASGNFKMCGNKKGLDKNKDFVINVPFYNYFMVL